MRNQRRNFAREIQAVFQAKNELQKILTLGEVIQTVIEIKGIEPKKAKTQTITMITALEHNGIIKKVDRGTYSVLVSTEELEALASKFDVCSEKPATFGLPKAGTPPKGMGRVGGKSFIDVAGTEWVLYASSQRRAGFISLAFCARQRSAGLTCYTFRATLHGDLVIDEKYERLMKDLPESFSYIQPKVESFLVNGETFR